MSFLLQINIQPDFSPAYLRHTGWGHHPDIDGTSPNGQHNTRQRLNITGPVTVILQDNESGWYAESLKSIEVL